MKPKLIIPIIGWTLIGGFSLVTLAVLVGTSIKDYEIVGLRSLAVSVIAITVLIAASVYLIGKHVERIKLRNPASYDRLTQVVIFLIIITGIVWLSLTEISSLNIPKSSGYLELSKSLAAAAFICFGVYEFVLSFAKPKRKA